MALRVAQVGSIWENIPPDKYGGTERVIYLLTEGLVKKGFDVTLFATGAAKTSAKLDAVVPEPLIRKGIPWTNMLYPLLHLTHAFDREHDFDLLHVHLNKSSDYLALPLARPIKDKVVFTFHFPYPATPERADRHEVLQKYKDLNFISISNSQRRGGENLNWLGTVYNGVDLTTYTFSPEPNDYVLWVGKFNPDKGTKEAIQAAKLAGVKLQVAGAIDTLDPQDKAYYEDVVKPMIDGGQVTYIGELTDEEKNKVYGQARALLNPIQWNEPFGLVMAEAMATGTPVIGFPNGAAPEIIVDGKTGFLVQTVEEMAAKISEVGSIDRKAVRARVEEHFSAETMVDGYNRIYEQLIKSN